AYLLRYNEASSRVDANSTLPDVRVVTEAAPSVVPASPKTALILAAVGLVALAGQVGGAIFGELMSGRALRPVQLFDPTPSEPRTRRAEPADVRNEAEREADDEEAPKTQRVQPGAATLLTRDGSEVADIASSDTRALCRELSERRERTAPPEVEE